MILITAFNNETFRELPDKIEGAVGLFIFEEEEGMMLVMIQKDGAFEWEDIHNVRIKGEPRKEKPSAVVSVLKKD